MQEVRRRAMFVVWLLRLGIVMSVIYASNSEELLELSCFSEKDCKQYQHSDMIAACVDNQCECKAKDGQVVPCQPPQLKKNNFIGGQCPCTQPNAECNTAQAICYCAIGYTASKDFRRCLKTNVTLDGACELDEQCQASDAFAICDTNICRCRVGYQQWGSVCAAQLAPTPFTCSVDDDCQRFGAAAKCADIGCLCDIGYVGASNMSACLPAVGLNATCKEQAQCQSTLGAAAICLHGHCACEELHVARPLSVNHAQLYCTRKLVVGQYCRNDEHCQDSNISQRTMFCDLGQCNCRWGYVQPHNGMYCHKSEAFKLKASHCWLLTLSLLTISLIAL